MQIMLERLFKKELLPVASLLQQLRHLEQRTQFSDKEHLPDKGSHLVDGILWLPEQEPHINRVAPLLSLQVSHCLQSGQYLQLRASSEAVERS
jgi:hypothetical protein